MKKYIVYKTTNTVNNKIYIGVHLEDTNKSNKYIGCGIYSNTSKCYTHFQSAVKKYGYDKFKREILFEYPDSEDGMEQAYAKEAELVNEDFIKRSDVYNMQVGGKLTTFENRKKKISQYSLDGKFIKSFDSIEEAKQETGLYTIAAAVLGISKYCGEFQWKEYDPTESDIDPITIKEKPVYQFDLQGNFLKVWKSASLASQIFKNPKAARSAIHNVCNKITRQAYGYYWSFKRSFEYNEYNQFKAVACYNDEGEFITSYSSLKEAATAMGLKDTSAISNCIRGKSKHAKGLRWRFFYGNTSSISKL